MKEYINIDKDGLVISKGSHNFEGFIEVDKGTVELGEYFIDGKVDPCKKMFDLKLEEIKSKFSDSIVNGKFFSETLGIEVDCRRNGKDNDIQNVRGLIDDMIDLGETKTDYIGTSETKKNITISQLEKLIIEMARYGRSIYQKKWLLKSQLKTAKSIEDLDKIKW